MKGTLLILKGFYRVISAKRWLLIDKSPLLKKPRLTTCPLTSRVPSQIPCEAHPKYQHMAYPADLQATQSKQSQKKEALRTAQAIHGSMRSPNLSLIHHPPCPFPSSRDSTLNPNLTSLPSPPLPSPSATLPPLTTAYKNTADSYNSSHPAPDAHKSHHSPSTKRRTQPRRLRPGDQSGRRVLLGLRRGTRWLGD